MNPRSFRRAALLPLLAAGLLAACSDQLPSDAAVTPPARRLTLAPTNAFVQFDAGSTHACGLTSSGQAWCWGRNSLGQLGDSTASSTLVPVAVYPSGWSAFSQVSAGALHTCAITASGQAWCWGNNGDGRLGDSTTNLGLAPVQVLPVGAIAFTSVSAGGAHTCGLDGSGQAWCWGNNAYGQIGDNSVAFAVTPVAVQQPVGVTFTQVFAGDKHTCALDTGGQAYCWGYGGFGAVGHGSFVGSRVPVAVSQPGGVTFASVVTEYDHSCGLTSGGQAYCWGLNSSSQLGDSTLVNRNTPVAVQQPGGLTFASLATGLNNTCGLTSAGQAYCWGNNGNGQLGIGSLTASRVPVAVSQPAGVTFTDVRAGSAQNFGLDTGGQTWGWGRNNFAQLGDGTTTQRTTPVAVLH